MSGESEGWSPDCKSKVYFFKEHANGLQRGGQNPLNRSSRMRTKQRYLLLWRSCQVYRRLSRHQRLSSSRPVCVMLHLASRFSSREVTAQSCSRTVPTIPLTPKSSSFCK